MFNGCYNFSNYTKTSVWPNDAALPSSAPCHCCPVEARPISQSADSAASAPLIETFMWMNYDLSFESMVAVQMWLSIKSGLQRLFFQCSEAKLFNQRGSSYTPKLAVIFHL